MVEMVMVWYGCYLDGTDEKKEPEWFGIAYESSFQLIC